MARHGTGTAKHDTMRYGGVVVPLSAAVPASQPRHDKDEKPDKDEIHVRLGFGALMSLIRPKKDA